ncbi:hypothetical protein SLEP1_g42383 [Rubroshorea leprosula]|uniref:Uncharacterized protein n=1 Tax=Rubroshorea leprosula TaxID=152421 RepID=A0AAV5L9M3_9ROSI|nr:hypothetical protein SLEP1_g42383 [Rubroshorea leprosula]
MNTIIEIYDDVSGKLLQLHSNLLINKLAFMDGEEINEQGKSLPLPFETVVNVRWTLEMRRPFYSLPLCWKKVMSMTLPRVLLIGLLECPTLKVGSPFLLN